MKKSIIYFIGMALALGAASCNSDDPSDACDKHVYAEGEAPYLRTNAAATNVAKIQIPVAKLGEAQYINLKDYATSFHKNLDMTVDEVMTAIGEGEVVVYNINSARQCWNLTAPTYGDNGWYYTSGGLVTTEDGDPMFTLSFDRAQKAFAINALDNAGAGTIATIDLGMAMNSGTDFDKYVRFNIIVEVTDPSIVECSGIVPAGDWESWSLDFNKYDEQLQAALGLSAKEFITLWQTCEPEFQWASVEQDPIQVYLIKNGQRVADDSGFRPTTTTNFMGWWLDREQNIVSWGDDCYIFLEGSDDAYNFGRHPNVESGVTATILVDFALTDDLDSHITFKVDLTFE